jgi:hypothetical protein
MPSSNKPSGMYVHHFESYYERNLVRRNFVRRGLTVKVLGYLNMIISVTSNSIPLAAMIIFQLYPGTRSAGEIGDTSN